MRNIRNQTKPKAGHRGKQANKQPFNCRVKSLSLCIGASEERQKRFEEVVRRLGDEISI